MEINKYEEISNEELLNILYKKKDEIEDINKNVNILEEELNTLKYKEKKINSKSKKILRKIIINLIYNLVYLIVIMSYIYPFINGFKVAGLLEKTIYNIQLYTGITIISLTVAIISVKIENKISEKRKSVHDYLQNQIKGKIIKIKENNQKQLELEREIDEIRNSFKEEPKSKINISKEYEEELKFVTKEEAQTISKTRKRTKTKTIWVRDRSISFNYIQNNKN